MIVLGIIIFLAMSLLIALFDFDMPSLFPYLFQGAAIIGLVQLFMSQSFINTGILSRAATDATRLSLSIVYLTSAVSTVVGLNVYLAVVRRKMALASAFSGALTMPIFTISALFVSSFIGSGGEVVFSPVTFVIVAVLMLVVNFGMFWLQRSAVRSIANLPGERGLLQTGPVSMPLEAPATDLPSTEQTTGLPLQLRSMRVNDDWEESPTKEEGEQ
ncbi:hypothetical protein AUF78_14440 [archaeon 13_1_20CM_2_51_12]|nr:MAG: hypothetical protein AUF78_14440 [archaeon 13_1_20CM_2_51_12]